MRIGDIYYLVVMEQDKFIVRQRWIDSSMTLHRIKSKDCVFHQELEKDAQCISDRLKQVVVSLIDNAWNKRIKG